MSKIFYAQENIRNKFKDYTSPKMHEQLVNLYALTDNEQQPENIISTLYSTANNSWGTEITFEQSDNKPYTYCIYNNGQIGNAPKDKYFVLTDNYYFADSPTNSTRWYTLDEMAQKPVSVSPSNIQPDIFSKTTGEKVQAYQYTDKQGITKYLIRKDKLENEANFRWLTYDEVENTEYSFEEIYKPLHFVNIGTDAATVQLELYGTNDGGSQSAQHIYEYSFDGFTWQQFELNIPQELTPDDRIVIKGPVISYTEKLYIRTHNERDYLNSYSNLHFILSGDIKAYGNVLSLSHKNDFHSTYIPDSQIRILGLFEDCVTLQRSPIIPETDCTDYDCDRIFYNCSSLSELHCYIPLYNDTADKVQFRHEDWMFGVPETCKLFCYSKEQMPTYDNLHFIKPLSLRAVNGNCNIVFKNTVSTQGTPLPEKEYWYTKSQTFRNDLYWIKYNIGDAIELKNGETIRFKGHKSAADTSSSYMQFEITGDQSTYIIASGNTSSLLSESENIFSIMKIYDKVGTNIFRSLFASCTNLRTAPELPVENTRQHCYASMFMGCTSLINMPTLYATEMVTGAYQFMFSGCTSLKNIQPLIATKLNNTCYRGMFYGCTSLTIIPELPATILAMQCYESMFNDCVSLTSVPGFKFITAAESCCASMFNNCVAIDIVNQNDEFILKPTKLYNKSYYKMFAGCKKLSKAPEICAIELGDNCCASMFNGCESLIQAPTLPAIKLALGCYTAMFAGCIKLNHIECLSEVDCTSGDYTTYWLRGVAKSGVFRCKNKNHWLINSDNGIPNGWIETEIDTSFYIENVHAINTAVSLNQYGTSQRTFEYSFDDAHWLPYTIGEKLPLSYNGRIYFRGNEQTYSSQDSNNYIYFRCDGKQYVIGGNINSLITENKNKYNKIRYDDTHKYLCYNMFAGNHGLFDASKLKLPGIAVDYCYNQMFKDCTGLVGLPALPSLSLGNSCYESMFDCCTSIEDPMPVLPGYNFINDTSINSYKYMFHACTSLLKTPKVLLRDITGHKTCQGMFARCTSLNEIHCYTTAQNETDCLGMFEATPTENVNFYGTNSVGEYNNDYDYTITNVTWPNVLNDNWNKKFYRRFYDRFIDQADVGFTSTIAAGAEMKILAKNSPIALHETLTYSYFNLFAYEPEAFKILYVISPYTSEYNNSNLSISKVNPTGVYIKNNGSTNIPIAVFDYLVDTTNLTTYDIVGKAKYWNEAPKSDSQWVCGFKTYSYDSTNSVSNFVTDTVPKVYVGDILGSNPYDDITVGSELPRKSVFIMYPTSYTSITGYTETTIQQLNTVDNPCTVNQYLGLENNKYTKLAISNMEFKFIGVPSDVMANRTGVIVNPRRNSFAINPYTLPQALYSWDSTTKQITWNTTWNFYGLFENVSLR